MHLRKKVAAIVLAGGTGSRFGGTGNKVYQPLNGKPVIMYSLEAFDSHPEVDEIIIVIREGEEDMLGRPALKKPYRIVTGGASRRESVYNGITATRADIVLIQDGARPFLKAYYITDCLKAIESHPGATIAVRSKDTVKLSYENNLVMRTTNRTNTWLVQTPQCFHRLVLVHAHEIFGPDDPTDDCVMLEKAKREVMLVSGDDTNIKITTRSDMILAEHILSEYRYV